MLILFTILVVLSAAITIPLFIKRRKTPSSENPRQLEPPPFRSLFEPSETELRALEREEKARLAARKRQNEEQLSVQKQEEIREFQKIWQISPNKKNTVELIRLSAAGESGKNFAEIAESVIQLWRAKKIEEFSGEDLAAVLESHFRLLPNEERTSGVAFWLKREIASLRAKSSGIN
jgi:hypothetical protein